MEILIKIYQKQVVLNIKISDVEIKISVTSSLVTATAFNAKISEVKNKIHDIDKYITTPEFNKLTLKNMAATC